MSYSTMIDQNAFFARYDRKMRLLLAAALCAGLVMSFVIAGQALATSGGDAKLVSNVWRFGILFPPLLTIIWWAFTEIMAHGRRKASPMRPVTSEVDAHNAIRIANAGLVFTIALTVVGVVGQVTTALLVFGHPLAYAQSIWSARLTMLTVGMVTIYLGNVWPRMPVSRAPEKRSARQMKVARLTGWFMVIFGSGIVLLGLFLPYIAPPTQPRFEPSKHREISLSPVELDKFVGRYDFGYGFVVSVTHRGPTLWVLREGSPAGEKGAPVFPEATFGFFWKAVEAQIRFKTDASGAVTGAEFREGGSWQRGKRLTT